MKLCNVPYNELKYDLKTGDIILFHGESLSSKFIQIIQGSTWSHVGMVIDPKDLGIKTDKLLLWESNVLENLEDVNFKDKKWGPMLVDLEQRLFTDYRDNKDRKFQVRFLDCQIDESHFEKLKKFVIDVHHDSFPNTDKEIIKEFLEGRIFDDKIVNDVYFCSELIADTYMTMGVLTKKHPANGYAPKDFSDEGKLGLLKRAILKEGPLIDIME